MSTMSTNRWQWWCCNGDIHITTYSIDVYEQVNNNDVHDVYEQVILVETFTYNIEKSLCALRFWSDYNDDATWKFKFSLISHNRLYAGNKKYFIMECMAIIWYLFIVLVLIQIILDAVNLFVWSKGDFLSVILDQTVWDSNGVRTTRGQDWRQPQT